MDLAFYRRLARDGVSAAREVVDAFDWNPDQPRDPDGKFGEGGGGGSGGRKAGEFGKPASEHEEKALSAYHEMVNHAAQLPRKLGPSNKEAGIAHVLSKLSGAAHAHTAANWMRNGLPEHIRPPTEGELAGNER